MASDGGGRREWSKPEVIVAVAALVVAVLMFWLTFAIGYTGSAGFRASVDGLVAWLVAGVGPFAVGVLVFTASAVVGGGALVLVVRLGVPALRLLRRKWLRWSRRRAEARGVPAVAEEGRPIAPARGAVSAEGVESWDECREAVAGFKVHALQVLYQALEGVEQGDLAVVSGSTVVRLKLNDLRPGWGGMTEQWSVDMMTDACRILKEAGFSKRRSVLSGPGGLGVAIRLADCLSGQAAARKVRQWVRDELAERGLWES